MEVFNKLTLRLKLLLLISLPLLLVLSYVVSLVLERQQDLDDAKIISQLARTTKLLSIVHRLQFERGKAVALVTDRKSTSLLDWRKAVEQTNQFSSGLPKLKQRLLNEGTDPVIVQTLERLQQDIHQLDEFRQIVEFQSDLTQKDVMSRYTSVVTSMHKLMRNLTKLSPGSHIFQLAESLAIIAELKEVQGTIRSSVTAILKRGKVLDPEIRHLITLDTKDNLLVDSFLSLAPLDMQEQFLRLGFDKSDAPIQSLVSSIITSKANQEISVDADLWFASATQRINQLRSVEKSLNLKLINLADKSRESAWFSLFITLMVAVITVGAVACIASIATGRLINSFIVLRDSAVEFTDSGELKTVPIGSSDELGQVAMAFNHLIEQLKSISDAVEAVAKGDFTQHVEVKSDKDRLALSLNHMVQTLRESVLKMTTENWLKTGQSELSVRINSDQAVQDLAQHAVTYIAEYLKAPVAAIYLLDTQETAELCATYAFTHRKEVRNGFKKGESLVGQAVLERKPIIIDQVPPDYIQVSSGLGSTSPSNVAVIPLIHTNNVIGVLELGTIRELALSEIDFLNKASTSIAVSLHSALSKSRLAELLEETQAQSEELQSQQELLEKSNNELEQQTKKLQDQQEKLEQANSELEEQTQQLEESQQELRTQKQQLSDANDELTQKTDELQVRNRDIEARSEELEAARQTLEAKAEELAAASKYKSEFLANMSHELRTPLNSLLLLAQSLKDNDDDNLTEQQLEAIKIIHGSGSDLLTLINDILDLSKVEAGKLSIENTDCEFSELVTQLERQFTPLAQDKNLQLRFNLDTRLPSSFYTDIQRLQQILRNLIGNAIKFTEEGFVELSVEFINKDSIQFSVKDSGIGVPPQLQKAIFEAFQQGDGSTSRKYSGTGLGLTISRELAHLLGGEIHMNSTEQKGSEFILKLPMCCEAEKTESTFKLVREEGKTSNEFKLTQSEAFKSVSNISPITKFSNDKKKSDVNTFSDENTEISSIPKFIEFVPDDRNKLDKNKDLLLIVEDDLVFSKCLMELAHTRQFQCVIAADVVSGIEMAKYFKPNAIVLDMILPDGQGEEVIRVLKADQKTRDIPIHVVSSLDQDDIKIDESIGVLTKPISKESIDRAFKSIVRHLHQESRRKILLIEDDRNTRKTIELLLKKNDITIVHAGTGKEGLKILKQEAIDCVILDLTLPDMNSMEILSKISGPDVKEPMQVVIYTGRDLSHDEYKNLRLYTDHIIIKGDLAQERLLNDVTLFLHSIKPNKNKVKPSELEPEEVLEGKKVLIVDDDMRNTFALANLLKRNGMEVIMADNGSLALDKLNERDDIELAIMDIMMPVMDGYEAIRKIRERADYKDLPIIALTAKAMPEDRDKCLQVGANDYLAKPVDSERLMSAIKMWGSAQ